MSLPSACCCQSQGRAGLPSAPGATSNLFTASPWTERSPGDILGAPPPSQRTGVLSGPGSYISNSFAKRGGLTVEVPVSARVSEPSSSSTASRSPRSWASMLTKNYIILANMHSSSGFRNGHQAWPSTASEAQAHESASQCPWSSRAGTSEFVPVAMGS